MPKRHKSATPPPPDADAILDAALGLAAERGLWGALRAREIAEAAGVSLGEVARAFPSRAAMAGRLAERVDLALLEENFAFEAEDSPRDRLFDVVMRRFDLMKPHRGALIVMTREAARDPLALAAAGPRLLRSMARMLEAAGISSGGLAGAVRARGLAFVYGRAGRVFLHDETADLARTMAALDRALARAEWAARALARWAPPPPNREGAAPDGER